MSFSSRKQSSLTTAKQKLVPLVACAVVVLAGRPAAAQYLYFQPRANVGAEVDSNRDLVTSGPTTTAWGADAEAGATVGYATPLSDTTLRPDVQYGDFPQLHESAVKSLIDLAWNYHTERAKFSLYGEFNYADLFNSELASAAFNPVNPNLPTTPETGRISLSGNRVLATVYPKFQFEFTPRLSFVAVGTYQDDTYNGVLTDEYVSYDYYDGTIGLDWSINPRSDISAGVGGSKQSARDVYSVTDGRDANVTYNYQWSPTFTGKLSLVAQHDQVTSEPQTGVGNASTSPVRFANTANGIGVQYQTLWTGQISSIQLTVGRTFTPNGSGGSFRSDAFQGEYKRQFTARLSFDGAARYIRNVALSDAYAYGDYDYVVATADLRWNLTPTWYVGGGVQYLNDRYPQYDASATNAMAHVTFGYEALGRQY